MKTRLLSIFLAVTMAATLLVGCSAATESVSGESVTDNFLDVAESEYKVALITDYGDITDQSFNQTTYEACKMFCAEMCMDFEYYKPNVDAAEARIAAIKEAVQAGYNVIVMPGYSFAGAIVEVTKLYKDVKFIALDVSEGDLLEAGVAHAGEAYDYVPENWKLNDYVYTDNLYCAIYQEELSGYMAGYAAVKMGYKKLGYLGGMEVPVVMRFGYGFVQGAEAAAKEMNVTGVAIEYGYGNQFFGDEEITAVMNSWYQQGTEVIFACGGGIYSSVAEAASTNGKKVIGVDTDQAAVIDTIYGEGLTVTSAMKGLYPTTIDTLTDVVINGKWADYAGKIANLGLVSESDVEMNYVQLPLESTHWTDSFGVEDYKKLVSDIYNGTIKISNDVSTTPVTTAVQVIYHGNVKQGMQDTQDTEDTQDI